MLTINGKALNRVKGDEATDFLKKYSQVFINNCKSQVAGIELSKGVLFNLELRFLNPEEFGKRYINDNHVREYKGIVQNKLRRLS